MIIWTCMQSFNQGIHYSDIKLSPKHLNSPTLIVCSTVCADWHQKKHESSASLAHCEGNPWMNSGFPSQRARNAENISISYCHHVKPINYIQYIKTNMADSNMTWYRMMCDCQKWNLNRNIVSSTKLKAKGCLKITSHLFHHINIPAMTTFIESSQQKICILIIIPVTEVVTIKGRHEVALWRPRNSPCLHNINQLTRWTSELLIT